MAIPKLRPYQKRAVDAVFAGWDSGLTRVAISAATGAGKSVCFGAVAREHLAHHRSAGPVVLLAHRRELIQQATRHFKKANPDLRVETVIGSPGRPGSSKRIKALYTWRRADVLVSTVQTLASPSTLRDFPDPSLVIVDEAHHSPANQWKKVLTALGCFSGTRALGVTATPFREDYRDFSDIWEAIVASIDIGWLIRHRLDPETGEEVECAPGEGYLVEPRLRHLTVDGLDLSRVPTSRMSGAVDYRDAELAEAMEAAGAFELVAKVVVSELADRKGVLFAPTVASSKHLAETLTNMGAPCHHVDGTMPTQLRDRIIADFRDDKVQWLSNVSVVSEGFDIPEIDAVVLARPTRSRIFFRQAVGRALRPALGKDHAIILDVVGASDGHSLAGVEALTDTEVLQARDGEQLSELLERTDRVRRGVADRITAHKQEAQDKQASGERSFQQIQITVEGLAEKLPGLEAFTHRAEPAVHEVLDATTQAVDLAVKASPALTLDQLKAIEERCAELVSQASRGVGRLEQLKATLRSTLMELREEPQGQVAKAMVTGYVGLVAGELFGEEEERLVSGPPKNVAGLKLRKGVRKEKPTFNSRYGWAIRSTNGHLYAPIHGYHRGVIGLAVSIKLNDFAYRIVHWDKENNGAVDFITPLTYGSEDEAYRAIVDFAAERTESLSLLNPAAPWRMKPASDAARAVAIRTAPQVSLPDEVTAGYVADVITSGQFDGIVNQLSNWVLERLANSVAQ